MDARCSLIAFNWNRIKNSKKFDKFDVGWFRSRTCLFKLSAIFANQLSIQFKAEIGLFLILMQFEKLISELHKQTKTAIEKARDNNCIHFNTLHDIVKNI